MGPHILMRGLPTSPNEPAGICSHGGGRGLRPLPKESDSSSASPIDTIASTAKSSVSVCRRGEVGKGLAEIPPEVPSGGSKRETGPRRPLTLLLTGHRSVLSANLCLLHYRTKISQGHPCQRDMLTDRYLGRPTTARSDSVWARTQVSDS
jgi:hypothetical protein